MFQRLAILSMLAMPMCAKGGPRKAPLDRLGIGPRVGMCAALNRSWKLCFEGSDVLASGDPGNYSSCMTDAFGASRAVVTGFGGLGQPSLCKFASCELRGL